MSTNILRLIPGNVHFLSAADAVSVAVAWLKAHIDAYRIEAVSPGHVTFFGCGGSFAIEITDTTINLSGTEIADIMRETSALLGCTLIKIDVRY